MFKSAYRAAAVSVIALGAVGGATMTAHAQSSADFPDVPANHWAYQAVHDLADKGLVKGYPDGKFLGQRALTRFEFATVVERLLETIADMKSGSTPSTGVTQDDLNKIQVLVDKFQPQLDAIQADVTKAQADIDTLRQNLEDLRQDVQDTKDIAAKAQSTANNSYGFGSNRKFQITGYIQARYISAGSDSESAGNVHYPRGVAAASSPYNGAYMSGGPSATPELRRSRLKVTGQVSQNTRYAIQIDASSTNSTVPVTVREGNINYTFNDGNPRKNLTLTAGLFANPFGYILPLSTNATLTPERPLAFNEGSAGIFNSQDYDKGAQLSYPLGRTKFTAAAVSGAGWANGATFPGTDSDRQLDQIYRVAYAGGRTLSGGISYYYGRLSTIPSAGSEPRMRKELKGADLQFTPSPNIFVNGEYINGIFEQRTAFQLNGAGVMSDGLVNSVVGNSTGYAPGNTIEGYYLQGGYVFSPNGSHPFTVAANYDVLDRAKDGAGSNSSYDDVNWSYGVLYNLDTQTRLRVWYTTPTAVAHTPATPSPSKVGLLTTELQVKF